MRNTPKLRDHGLSCSFAGNAHVWLANELPRLISGEGSHEILLGLCGTYGGTIYALRYTSTFPKMPHGWSFLNSRWVMLLLCRVPEKRSTCCHRILLGVVRRNDLRGNLSMRLTQRLAGGASKFCDSVSCRPKIATAREL